jgi:cyclopropane-fatty-acyl-phospholipid synthase
MTHIDDIGAREQLAIRPASKLVRLFRVLSEGLVYGASYAAPNYFSHSVEPIDPDRVWQFFARKRASPIQAFIDHYPLAAQRRHLIAQFLSQSYAKGIEYHYNVSNDFYELFLDRRFMFYSCADFHSPTDTIEQAQLNKANHILSLLDPKPGEKIIELGCGWGSMLRHIQASIGESTNLYGITLSRDQVSYIRDKFGFNILLNDFVSVDYGVETYDKIYSIGSLEHVRPDDILPLYKKFHAALKLGGRAILHFFSLNGTDRVPTSQLGAQIFFPGSILSLHSDHLAHAKEAGFTLTHSSEHDYRPTLRTWFDRLVENRCKAHALVGTQVVNKYLTFFASSWSFFNLKKATVRRLVLMKN